MSRFPLLEQLRAERERTAEPVAAERDRAREESARARVEAGGLRDALRALESAVAGKLGEHIVATIGRELGAELRRAISMAIATISPHDPVTTIQLPTAAIRFYDPSSWEKVVLDRYLCDSLPRLGVRLEGLARDRARQLTVTLPSVSCTRTFIEDEPRRRRA